MALKDIFTMVKADRYTADGCEELNKARESDVEDRVYQIGEISEKTGLQKTANGWVKPKKGAAGAKTGPGKSPDATGGKWKENKDFFGRKRISMETPQGGKVSIYESENPKQKNARFRVDTGDHYNEFNTMEEAKAFAEEHYGEKTKGNAESKPAEKKSASAQEFIKIPTAKGYAKVPKEAYSKYANNNTNVRLSDYIGKKMKGKSSYESNKFYDFVEKKIYESGEDPKPYLGQGGYSYPQSLIDMYYDEWNSKTNDSAPRVLTGDTRIRVRKETKDRTYTASSINEPREKLENL